MRPSSQALIVRSKNLPLTDICVMIKNVDSLADRTLSKSSYWYSWKHAERGTPTLWQEGSSLLVLDIVTAESRQNER
jgi:hypothetical protein